jgi:two-component system chemotaxis sensor kinase CheA
LRDGSNPLTSAAADRLLDILDRIGARLAELPPPEGIGNGAAGSAAAPPAGLPAVDLPEVDALVRILDEAAAALESLRNSAEAATGALANGIGRVDRELRLARDKAEQLRLMPVSRVLGVLERTVRDGAQAGGKQVAFETRGGEVRLDAQVLDALQAPLVQLVRNAVAHGIETPAERERAGKPATGRVSVEAEQSGHQVMLRCRDDGRGVNLEAVRAAIQRRGASPQAARELGTGDLVAALLHGGISTSEAVTEHAGRGVGLDVVRDAVQRLGGSVAVHTEANRGTTIELKVRVSLSVLDVLSVEAGGQRAAIPLSAVRCVLRVAPHEVAYSPAGDSLVHEGAPLALRPLSLGCGARPRGTRGPVPAVVVQTEDLMCALTVDRLLGVDTVVARPLPPLAPAEPIVAGVHFDVDGSPCLLLDPKALAAEPAHLNETPPPTAAFRPVLVIDDSPTTRMLESSILTSAGFAVDVASSAEEALQMARQRDYGLFLVDIEMPGVDGFGFIERVRRQARLREVPCVLVSSRDTPQDRQRGEAVGARAFIAKSDFDQNDFLRRVAALALR